MKKIGFLLIVIALSSCFKKKFAGPNSYEDNFENVATFDALFSTNDGWNHSQITKFNSHISVIDTFAHTGLQCLQFNAEISTDELLSKCSLVKQKMAFYEGETVRADAWYYIQGSENLDWLFLMDIEEQATIGAGPGLRIAVVNNQLVLNSKYLADNTFQPEGNGIEIPRNEWFKLTLEIKLDQRKKGWAKVYQNDQLVIERTNFRSLPRDRIYNIQGTKGMYTSIEIGATANSYNNAVKLFIDDFSIKTL